MTNLKIRPANDADIPTILDIYNEAILNSTASYHYDPRSPEQWQAWFAGKMQEEMPVLVAVDPQNVVLGWATFGIFRGAWAGYRFSVEHSLYVAQGQRGQGIGKLMLQTLIDTARQRHYHTLIAGIDSTNLVSLKLHQSLGFFQVAHFQQVGYKFDRWLDLIFMQLMV